MRQREIERAIKKAIESAEALRFAANILINTAKQLVANAEQLTKSEIKKAEKKTAIAKIAKKQVSAKKTVKTGKKKTK